MPELPEVETVVRSIAPSLIGEVINCVTCENDYCKVFSSISPQLFNQSVKGREIINVNRRGKFIVLELVYGFIFIHLRMTGRLLTQMGPNDRSHHLTAVFHFESGKKLFFKDYRKFGRLYYAESMSWLNKKLGVEPLGPDFTFNWLQAGLAKSSRQIKPLLLDQSFIAGLGNIYVDEGLWAAHIHPATPANKIKPEQIEILHRATQEILGESIKKNGTTIINFQFGAGNTGEFVNELKVFNRAGQPCPVCATPIIKIRIAQRGTHLCPKCQILPD